MNKKLEKIPHDMFWASVEAFEDMGMSEHASKMSACEIYSIELEDIPWEENDFAMGVLPE